ncbi:MAG: glycosyltransferase, partial [Patescibacteria group bacterium]|nr:glycosyltransferase [Patescibacteria group bacterium]
VNVVNCIDTSTGLRKYWNLYKKHRDYKGKYDAMIVGFPGFIIVPFARLIATAPVYFDALCSFYETQIISRDAYKGNIFRIPYVRIIDWLATRLADKILVETEQQKKYFIGSLGVNPAKLIVVYTGVDDSIFHTAPDAEKSAAFTVLFRGRITREAGAAYVLRAAKILENTGVKFLIIGFGWAEAMNEFKAVMNELKPANVEYISKQLPFNELIPRMLSCHVSLGQFENNERLKRTIPHKAFESMAMKLPYVTSRMAGVSEVFKDGETCLMVNPADPEDLAAKIETLKNSPVLAEKIAQNAFWLYQQRFTPQKIVQPILDAVCNPTPH